MNIPVDKIKCNHKMNVSRKSLTPADCESIAQDIARHGLIQPISVIPCGEDQYEVAVGFRRFTAMAINLGWTEIPCIVKDWDRKEARLRNIIENIQRNDLSYWEECRALMLQYKKGTKVKEISLELSKSDTWVIHRWLSGLPQEIVDQVELGLLGPAEVGVIILQKTEAEQVAAAKKMQEGKARGETVRDLQRELTGRKNNRSKSQVKQVMSRVMELGAETDKAAVHALRYATGEISDTLLYEMLDSLRD